MSSKGPFAHWMEFVGPFQARSVRMSKLTAFDGSGSGHPTFQPSPRRGSPRRAPREFHKVRFRTIALHEGFKERVLVFAIMNREREGHLSEQCAGKMSRTAATPELLLSVQSHRSCLRTWVFLLGPAASSGGLILCAKASDRGIFVVHEILEAYQLQTVKFKLLELIPGDRPGQFPGILLWGAPP
jgi:hypothetical protein